ncbi:MAG TPA: PDZ domain-containing protein [Phycisphaerae bacterium]|nr:PDZ domain-containing protein [Phycisphaerae bacterium]
MIRLLLLFSSVCLSTPGRASSQPADGEVDRLVRDLRSPVWRVRDEATSALMEKGTEIFEPLRREFEHTRSYETRRRIKDVAREVYLTDKLGPPMAFLGISHNNTDLRSVDEPRLEPGMTALRIECIFPGTAADRAGIQPGDLLLSINGRRATSDDPALNMTKWIASQKPGTPCKIGVLRGGHGIRLESTNLREFNIERFNKLKLQPASARDSCMIPARSGALRLIEAARMNKDVTLQPGDLIIALNDQPLPAQNPLAAFGAWIAGINKMQSGTTGEEELRMNANGQPQLVQRPTASIQIVRGGDKLDLSLRLGRRPVFLRTSIAPAWQGDPAAVEEAQNTFESWWGAFFDPTHSFVEQASSDPAWRLEPRGGAASFR